MNIQSFREFLHVAQTLNISESARQLHLSQPALSHHVALLENDLGVQLFVRSTPLALTSGGRELAKRAGAFLDDFEELVEGVRQAQEGYNELRIAYQYDMSACHQNAYGFLGKFVRTCYSKGTVNRIPCEHTTAFDAITSHDLDCVVEAYAPIPSDIEKGVVFERLPRLVSNRVMLWVPKNSPLSNSAAVTWEDIRQMTIGEAPGGPLKLLCDEGLNRLFDQHGIESAPNSDAAMQGLSMFDANSDVVFAIDETFSKYPIFFTNSDRVFVPIDEDDARNEAYLAYLPDRVRPILQRVLDFLHEQEQ